MGVLIDPGAEPQKILKRLEALRTPSGNPIRIQYLLHTHAHLDHIGATRGVREALEADAPHPEPAIALHRPAIALHRDDEPLYQNLKMQGQLFGMSFEDPLPVDHFLLDEEALTVGTLRFSVIHTPGHSPGSVCLRLHEDSRTGARESVFSGDTLFAGSVGRTDLWGGDQEQLFRSIRGRIFTLDDDIRVCPGHGPESSVGIEKRENPFFR